MMEGFTSQKNSDQMTINSRGVFRGALCHVLPSFLTLLLVKKEQRVPSDCTMPDSFDGVCSLRVPAFKISRCVIDKLDHISKRKINKIITIA